MKTNLNVIFENLWNKYSDDVAWELFYLYMYLCKQNRQNEFNDLVKLIPLNLSVESVSEYVKALTHDIDIHLFNDIVRADVLIEVRRFFEDLILDEKSDELVKMFLQIAKRNTVSSKYLYELRRFLKSGNQNKLYSVLKYAKDCEVESWQLIDLLLENINVINEDSIRVIFSRFKNMNKLQQITFLLKEYDSVGK